MLSINKNPVELFRPAGLPSGVPWRLFVSAFLFVLLVVLVYAGLGFGYRPYLESRIEEVDQQISQLTAAISQEDQENFIRFYSQLINFNKILESHLFSSKLLLMLEDITHQRVSYTGFDLRVVEKKLTLEGTAASFEVLAEQLASYDREPKIKNYLLNQSQYSEGAVKFKVSLELTGDVFK